MCRLLAAHSAKPAELGRHLDAFATMAQSSKEYQGHGWGVVYRSGSAWRRHRDVRPIWECSLPKLPETTLMVAHARSAFRNEGIAVENNMPFFDAGRKTVFAFNGELRGVRVRADGRIGAEKVFRFAERFRDLGWDRALEKAAGILEKRSEYVRALNAVVSDGAAVYAYSRFNEDPDYFTLHYRSEEGGETLVASEPLSTSPRSSWSAMKNKEGRRFP